jgi:hypothetical protein
LGGPKNWQKCYKFTAIQPLLLSESAAAANRLSMRASAAQQRLNVGILKHHGKTDREIAFTAGRRVSGKQKNNTTQNQ